MVASSAIDQLRLSTASGVQLSGQMALIATKSELLLVALAGMTTGRPRKILLRRPLSGVTQVQVIPGGVRQRFALRFAGERAPVELEGARGRNRVADVVAWLRVYVEQGPEAAGAVDLCARCQQASATQAIWCHTCAEALENSRVSLTDRSEIADLVKAMNEMLKLRAVDRFDTVFAADLELRDERSGAAVPREQLKAAVERGPTPASTRTVTEAIYRDGDRYWIVESDWVGDHRTKQQIGRLAVAHGRICKLDLFQNQAADPTTGGGRSKSATPPIEGQGTKVCPECAETVKSAAKICRFCRHSFASADSDREAISSGTDEG
jgi:hypothetical protein